MRNTPSLPALPFMPLKAALRRHAESEKLWRPSDAAQPVKTTLPIDPPSKTLPPLSQTDKAAA